MITVMTKNKMKIGISARTSLVLDFFRWGMP